ncbi:MAG TPA: hypothetical protein VF794_12820 [Archangium sp.]|jgi:hypothetical protein|uniref:hypothetical protein n=1 Tax=Archangium sp. TaxID=1872627 RepID=UPI002ED9A551
MRRAVLIAVGVLVGFLACRTTQPPGTENREPIEAPAQREEIQTVPNEPPGTGEPLTAPDSGTMP